MKFLTLLPFMACMVAGCGGAQSDATTDSSATADASIAADTFTSKALTEDNPMESVAIDFDQAGIITIGMSMDEVYQWFDSAQIRKLPGKKPKTDNPTQAYSVFSTDAAPLLTFSVSALDTVTSIIVQNPAYQTEKGIGVGSTFSQLSRAYHIARIITTKDKQVIATVEELQKKQLVNGEEVTMAIRFELGVDASALLLENNTVLPSSVPPETRITRIFL